MGQQAIPEQIDRLKAKVEAFSSKHERLRLINNCLNVATVLLGILLAVGSAWEGFMYNDPHWAAFLGVLLGALITYDKAFPHGEKAEFYQIIVAESKSLLDDLEFRVDTYRKFNNALKRFQTLRKYAAEKLPRGKGMETVKNMSEELRSIGFTS